METKSTRFSEISNTFFLLITLFLIFFLWCNFYLHNMKISLNCSIIIIITFSIIYIPIKLRNYKKSQKKNILSEKNTYYKNQLLLSDDNSILDFIIKLFDYKEPTKINQNHCYIDDENKDIFICYKQEELSIQDIYYIYKQSKSKNIDVYLINKPTDNININNKTINYIDFTSFINKCNEKDYYFDNDIVIQNKTKFRIKDIICLILCKKRSKSYLWLGFLVLFSSMFTPYNVYYLVFSTILFLLSIYSRFNTKFNK